MLTCANPILQNLNENDDSNVAIAENDSISSFSQNALIAEANSCTSNDLDIQERGTSESCATNQNHSVAKNSKHEDFGRSSFNA